MSSCSPFHNKSFRHFLIFIISWLFSMSTDAATGCQVIPAKSALTAKKEQISPFWLSHAPEGRAESPISLTPKQGTRRELAIIPAQPCFLDFSLHLPSVMSLHINAVSGIASFALELSTSDTEPKHTMTGEQIAAGPGSFHVRYALPAAWYQLKVVGIPQSRRLKPVRIALVIDEMRYDAPSLSLTAKKTEVILDPITREVFRQFFLERHSLVRLSLSKVPGLGEYQHDISIDLRNASDEPALEVEKSRRSEKSDYVAYILKPGHYFIKVYGDPDGRPSPPPQGPTRSSAPIELHIDAVPYDVPTSMLALSAWLKQTGLDEMIEFNEFTDLRQASRNLPGAYARNFPLAAQVTAIRTHQRLCKVSPPFCQQLRIDLYALRAENIGELSWPSGSEEADRPALVVTFQVKIEREAVGATEAEFYKTHGITLWNRLLQKISNLEGVSARKIVVEAPVSCSGHLVYMDESNSARRHGAECESASALTPLGIAVTMNAAVQGKLPGTGPSLSETVRPFLTKFLADKDATFDFLILESEYVEVIIRGMRGRVVRGGRDWEKLLLTLSITGTDPRMLHASIDGQLASGIGSYPADSQFTRDMDVDFKGNVTEYSKKLVTAFRAFLEGKL